MEIVERDGKQYIKTEYTVDFGKAGAASVTVYDPCITEEARTLRAQALVRKTEELIRRGIA